MCFTLAVNFVCHIILFLMFLSFLRTQVNKIVISLRPSSSKQTNKFVQPAGLRNLRPVYMEKTCPGLKGHPPSSDNFSEPDLYEKKS